MDLPWGLDCYEPPQKVRDPSRFACFCGPNLKTACLEHATWSVIQAHCPTQEMTKILLSRAHSSSLVMSAFKRPTPQQVCQAPRRRVLWLISVSALGEGRGTWPRFPSASSCHLQRSIHVSVWKCCFYSLPRPRVRCWGRTPTFGDLQPSGLSTPREGQRWTLSTQRLMQIPPHAWAARTVFRGPSLCPFPPGG